MHWIRFDETGFKERVKGEYDRTEDLLVSPELTEASAVATVRMKKGFETKAHSHDDMEQIFIVLEGRGELTLRAEKREIEKGALFFIPKGIEHRIVATSDELVYIYVSVWPDGKPPGLKPGFHREGRILDLHYE
ncbi:MAG TPA: cupin domain-containing protein [Spirochaetia bacterium]|nr:cupin domain-containing protein [Spirochaetia bacterium]